jgi:hypothetical protein
MRCIHCLTDNNLRERQANKGCCSKCGHFFAFEPKTATPAESGITDKLVSNAIKDASAGQSIYFTEKQFYYVLQRRIASIGAYGTGGFLPLLAVSSALILIAPIGFFLSFSWLGFPDLAFAFYIFFLICALPSFGLPNSRIRSVANVLIFALSVLLAVYAFEAAPASIAYFIRLLLAGIGIGVGIFTFVLSSAYHPRGKIIDSLFILDKFSRVHGGGERLLPAIGQQQPPSRPSTLVQADEFNSYSFDRVLFCESESIAQFLIANHFHFEHNCAVLTPDGYPALAYNLVLNMLKSNPSLKAYCIHDCSLNGMQFLSKLRASQPWLEDANLTICDLGLLPRQVLKSPQRFFIRRVADRDKKLLSLALPGMVVAYLQPQEMKWLMQGFYVELESIPPQRLLQFLARGVLEQITPEQVDPEAFPLLGNSIMYVGVDSFG